jgi:hypothetical protein
MPAFKTKEELDPNWKKQIEYFSKKCKLTEEEKKLVLNLSKKLNLEPQRVIETIGVNSNKGKISEETIKNYEISIQSLSESIQKDEKKLKEIKKNKKQETKSIIGKIKESFSEEKILESEIEFKKRKLEKYKKIQNIIKNIKNTSIQIEYIDNPKEIFNYYLKS